MRQISNILYFGIFWKSFKCETFLIIFEAHTYLDGKKGQIANIVKLYV